MKMRTVLLVQWLILPAASAAGLSLIPGQRTRSHMPQLTVQMLPLKILHGSTKTQCSQMNKINILKNKMKRFTNIEKILVVVKEGE